MSKKFISVALTSIFLVSCGDPQARYGETGWEDDEEMSTVITRNSAGETLSVAVLELFGNKMTSFSVDFTEKSFQPDCEESEATHNIMGHELNIYRVSAELKFPQDATKNKPSFDTIIRLGEKGNTGAEGHGLLLSGGNLFGTLEDIIAVSELDKVDILMTDKCGQTSTFYFNTMGNVSELALTQEGRKESLKNADAEEQFQ